MSVLSALAQWLSKVMSKSYGILNKSAVSEIPSQDMDQAGEDLAEQLVPVIVVTVMALLVCLALRLIGNWFGVGIWRDRSMADATWLVLQAPGLADATGMTDLALRTGRLRKRLHPIAQTIDMRREEPNKVRLVMESDNNLLHDRAALWPLVVALVVFPLLGLERLGTVGFVFYVVLYLGSIAWSVYLRWRTSLWGTVAQRLLCKYQPH